MASSDPDTRAEPSGLPWRPGAVLLVAVAYAVVARLGSLTTTLPGGVSPIFPSAGIALAAVLVLGLPAIPGVWLGSVVANAIVFTQDGGLGLRLGPKDLLIQGLIAAGASLAAWAGATLVRRLAGDQQPLGSARAVLVLVTAGAFGSAAVSASVGLVTLSLADIMPWGLFGYTWITWLLGDAFGIVIAAPLILAWRGHGRPRWALRPTLEAAALGSATVALCAVVFVWDRPIEYGLLPLLVWAALRFGVRGATTTATLVAVFAAVGTGHGGGPFVRESANASLLVLDLFLGVTIGCALLFAGILAERSRVQAELASREAAYLKARELEVLGRISGTVAHDFNNALAVILAAVDELERAQLAGRLGLTVRDLRTAAEQAQATTRQLRVFGPGAPRPPTVVALAPVVERAGAALKRILPATVELTLEVRAEPHVSADEGQLMRILTNLALNARDAMRQGGRLTLRLRPSEGDAGLVALEVADTGTGMSEEVKARIFDPYFTTKGEQGTGLGLASVRQLVLAAGGRVAVDSALGRGTTVTVLWPVAPAPGASPRAA
jgi:signal transduction histidine kinase